MEATAARAFRRDAAVGCHRTFVKLVDRTRVRGVASSGVAVGDKSSL